MDKRDFLKETGAILAGTMLARHTHADAQNPAPAETARSNWAGNYTFKAAHLDEPIDIQETQQLVKRLANVKALGARHSFNNIADTSGDQISLKRFDQMALNKDARSVTVGAALLMESLRHGSTHRASRSTTSRLFLTSLSLAPAPPEPTAPASITAISLLSSPLSTSSMALERLSLSPAPPTPTSSPERLLG